MDQLPQLVKIRRAAEAADTHPTTIYRWIREGVLEGVQLGGQLRVVESSLLELINSGKRKAA